MNQGWFGNADLGAGTKDRYTGRMMLNRFVDKTQFSIIGSANNVMIRDSPEEVAVRAGVVTMA